LRLPRDDELLQPFFRNDLPGLVIEPEVVEAEGYDATGVVWDRRIRRLDPSALNRARE
jgi:hypothetical protein